MNESGSNSPEGSQEFKAPDFNGEVELTGPDKEAFDSLSEVFSKHEVELSEEHLERAIEGISTVGSTFSAFLTRNHVTPEEAIGWASDSRDLVTSLAQEISSVASDVMTVVSSFRETMRSDSSTKIKSVLQNRLVQYGLGGGSDQEDFLSRLDDVMQKPEMLIEHPEWGLGSSDLNIQAKTVNRLGEDYYNKSHFLNLLQSICAQKAEIVEKSLDNATDLDSDMRTLETPFFQARMHGYGESSTISELVGSLTSGEHTRLVEKYEKLGIDVRSIRESISANPEMSEEETIALVRAAILDVQQPWEKKFNKLAEIGIMDWWQES